MQNISDGTTINLYIQADTDPKSIHIRRSFDIFQNKPQQLVLKHNSFYKALPFENPTI